MQPAKRKRNREPESIRFRGEEGQDCLWLVFWDVQVTDSIMRVIGCLEPKIWCESHFPEPGRTIHAIADRDNATHVVSRL